MRVCQAVFGAFHHFELAHQLRRRGHLQRLYSTWPWARLKREGLPHAFVRTFPLLHTAEYLLGRTGHAPAELLSKLAAWNALAFDRYTLFQLARDASGWPDVFIAISGAGLLTGTEVQRRGGIFLCDRGSTHQRFQDTIVRAEYVRWKLPPPPAKPHIVAREEAIYAQADAITVPSTVAKRSFLQMGVPAEKVYVIPYGVRLDKFSPATRASSATTPSPGIGGHHPAPGASQMETYSHQSVPQSSQSYRDEQVSAATSKAIELPGPDPDAFNVLFAGAVSLRKGVPYLLQAFADLRHPHKHLTVVGHVPGEMRPLLARLPTQDVTFTGSLPQPELARIMRQSHAPVLPSIEEGLALVQGQAMACGCPIIATAATGAEDLFAGGSCSPALESLSVQPGFIIPATPENLAEPTAALLDCLQRLADSPGLQRAMRQAALDRVQQLGGWDHYGDLWEALLLNLRGC